MSAHSAISLPPPTHQPCTCAITGFGLRHSDMNRGTQPIDCDVAMMRSRPASHSPSVAMSSFQCVNPPAKLKPAQNERPAPCRRITFTARSRIDCVTASSSSSSIGGTIVLRSSGRSSVMTAVASCTA